MRFQNHKLQLTISVMLFTSLKCIQNTHFALHSTVHVILIKCQTTVLNQYFFFSPHSFCSVTAFVLFFQTFRHHLTVWNYKYVVFYAACSECRNHSLICTREDSCQQTATCGRWLIMERDRNSMHGVMCEDLENNQVQLNFPLEPAISEKSNEKPVWGLWEGGTCARQLSDRPVIFIV